MKKCIIVARAKNNVIGSQGDMPWHFPEDLKHFKEVTMGCPVIMGSRTFDSIGKPLPGRLNIVLSSRNLIIDGVEVVKSLEDAYRVAGVMEPEKVFVIGGASVYRQAMEDGVDLAYVTEIGKEFDGDTVFDYDFSGWETEELGRVSGDTDLVFRLYRKNSDPE